MYQILILDENEEHQKTLREGLSHAFSVFATTDDQVASEYAILHAPSAILLDTGKCNNTEICRKLRLNVLTRHIPILAMADDLSPETVNAVFEMDADDCIQKPINLDNLELRLKARIRRAEEVAPRRYRIGDIVLVPDRKEVELAGKPCHLSPTEFKLLRVFVLNPNRSISRLELLNTIWQDAVISNRTVDVHVSALRRKLVSSDYQIYSIYGSGYILRKPTEDSHKS